MCACLQQEISEWTAFTGTFVICWQPSGFMISTAKEPLTLRKFSHLSLAMRAFISSFCKAGTILICKYPKIHWLFQMLIDEFSSDKRSLFADSTKKQREDADWYQGD
jgi:hypothetical protein